MSSHTTRPDSPAWLAGPCQGTKSWKKYWRQIQVDCRGRRPHPQREGLGRPRGRRPLLPMICSVCVFLSVCGWVCSSCPLGLQVLRSRPYISISPYAGGPGRVPPCSLTCAMIASFPIACHSFTRIDHRASVPSRPCGVASSCTARNRGPTDTCWHSNGQSPHFTSPHSSCRQFVSTLGLASTISFCTPSSIIDRHSDVIMLGKSGRDTCIPVSCGRRLIICT